MRRATAWILLTLAVPSPVTGPAYAAPTAAAASTGPGREARGSGSYLDYLAGKAFQSPTGSAKVTINEKGEWRLQAPGGGVDYIARDAVGSYVYWITSPMGLRQVATGTVGDRGVSVCWKSLCHYWVTAADGSDKFLTASVRKDGSLNHWDFDPLIADGEMDKSALAAWQRQAGQDGARVARGRTSPEEYLGFALADIDTWIAQAGGAVARTGTALAALAPRLPVSRQAVPATVQPAGREVAMPQAVSVAASAPVDSKRWGALAGYIGSHWKSPTKVYSIEWDRPGEVIRIGFDGLLGAAETLVVPDADGKSLRYVFSNPATGMIYDDRVAVERGKSFVLRTTATVRAVCKPAEGGLLNCIDRRKLRDKQPEPTSALARTDAAGAQAFLSAFPNHFPGRPPGRFDPQYGMLAEMAGRRWTEDPKPSSYSTSELFEFGGTPQGRALITRIRGQFGSPRVAYLQASGSGALSGTYYSGTVDSPNAMAGVSLTIDAEGVASICSAPGCDQWRVSRDGQLALRMRAETGSWTATIFRPVPAAPPTGRKLYDDLNGKIFRAPNGRTVSFTASPGNFAVTMSWSRGERQSTVCYTTATPDVAECSGPSGVRKGLPFVVRETGVSVDGYSFVLLDGKMVRRNEKSNEQLIFQPSSVGLVELDYHADEDQADQRRLRRENRIQTAAKERREREMIGAIMGAAQAIGGALAANSSASNYTPSYRGSSSSGGIGQPSGYAGMGTSSFTPMPMASPAYIKQQDELERFRIREQIYGTAPRTAERPYAKAYEQLARDNAASDVRKAELRAQVDASREQEARAFAASPASGGTPANAPSATVDDGRRAQLDREAADRRTAAEAERRRVAEVEAAALKRRQDEAEARVEKERRDKLAADAERSRKAEIAARERAPVAWKEGVVLCEPPKSGKGEWSCHGPLQTTYGVPDKPSGAIAVRQACGGGTIRELGQAGGFRTYGCGFGTSPLNAPSRDPATRFGVFVPGRGSFTCPRNQPGVCYTN